MTRADVSALLTEHYGLEGADLLAIDTGADLAASLWRATDRDGRRFAVKWSGGGSAAGLVLPAALNAARPGSAPTPLRTRTGALWVDTGGRRLSVMEWISGTSALEAAMGRDEWSAVGRVLAALHGLARTGDVRSRVPREDFDPGRWAKLFERVDAALDRRPAGKEAQRLADMWGGHRAQLREVHRLTLGLAEGLRERTGLPGFVACHADPHLGNLVLTAEGAPVLIDFDDAVLAPRERDLMFVLGGGVLADAAATPQQQNWFSAGYGPHTVDTDLITYYRGLRTLEDASEPAWAVLDPQNSTEERCTALDHVGGVLSPTGLLAQTLTAAP